VCGERRWSSLYSRAASSTLSPNSTEQVHAGRTRDAAELSHAASLCSCLAVSRVALPGPPPRKRVFLCDSAPKSAHTSPNASAQSPCLVKRLHSGLHVLPTWQCAATIAIESLEASQLTSAVPTSLHAPACHTSACMHMHPPGYAVSSSSKSLHKGNKHRPCRTGLCVPWPSGWTPRGTHACRTKHAQLHVQLVHAQQAL
jgi:hypothetical protein